MNSVKTSRCWSYQVIVAPVCQWGPAWDAGGGGSPWSFPAREQPSWGSPSPGTGSSLGTGVCWGQARMSPQVTGLGRSWRLALLQGWCHCHWASGWAQMGLLGHRSAGKSCSHPPPKQKQNCYVTPAKSVCRFWGEQAWRRQCVGKGPVMKERLGRKALKTVCAAPWHTQQHQFHIQWSEIRHQIKDT